MSKAFENSVILVTGGGSGIGQATVWAFAELGAKVIVADINAEAARQTAERAGALARALPGDVTLEADVAAWMDAAAEMGGLKAAVNCAGIEQPPVAFEHSDAQTFERVMRVNAFGVWLCMRHELTAMLRSGGGVIVNVSSIAGMVGTSMQQAYPASKHAVIGLTRAAALDFATRGIRVNAICPGATMTPMIVSYAKHDPSVIENGARAFPIKRWAEPREIADAILYLCSEAASYVTGAVLPVDGGYTAA
jgi:NAD(P)-dependent dehydrogenase (short-subunit alcohol dehydrogenase family)